MPSGSVIPAAAGDGLDGLHRHLPICAERREGFHVGAVLGILEQYVAEGQQHRIEREPLQAA